MNKPETNHETRIGKILTEQQKKSGKSDAELATLLGLEGETLVSLIKKGILLPSHCMLPQLRELFEEDMAVMLEMAFNDHGRDGVWHFQRNLDLMRLSDDENQIIRAYRHVLNGEQSTQHVKVPGATVFVVPDGRTEKAVS